MLCECEQTERKGTSPGKTLSGSGSAPPKLKDGLNDALPVGPTRADAKQSKFVCIFNLWALGSKLDF